MGIEGSTARWILPMLVGAALASSLPVRANDELWLSFAHPESPHILEIYDEPVSFARLFPDAEEKWNYETQPLSIPMYVSLLRYLELGPVTAHTPAFFADLAFNLTRSKGASGRPSFAEMIHELSNGRLLIVPAVDGEASWVAQDGVSEWNVAAWQTACNARGDIVNCDEALDEASCLALLGLQNVQTPGLTWRFWGSHPYYLCHALEKRKQAVQQADPWFDYARYDDNSDKIIDGRELIVLPISADRQCEEHYNHASPIDVIGDPGTGETHSDKVGVCYRGGGQAWEVTTPVEAGSYTLDQRMAMYPEQAGPGFWLHELGHCLFSTEDLYESSSGKIRTTTGYFHAKRLKDALGNDILDASGNPVLIAGEPQQPECPPGPGWFMTPMEGGHSNSVTRHLSPWTKIHLGFTLPAVVTHDGLYRIYDVETVRNYAEQRNAPEALVIYDPLAGEPFESYFVLEFRNAAWLPDKGLAVWLVDERLIDDPSAQNKYSWDMLRANRLLLRGGFWTPANGRLPDNARLWDGSEASCYDITTTSAPRTTDWLDPVTAIQSSQFKSYVEIRNISTRIPCTAPTAGSYMEVTIRMPPIFINGSWMPTIAGSSGSQSRPWLTIREGIDAIPPDGYMGHDWHPRTLRIAPGVYGESADFQQYGKMVIDEQVSLMASGTGSVLIGK